MCLQRLSQFEQSSPRRRRLPPRYPCPFGTPRRMKTRPAPLSAPEMMSAKVLSDVASRRIVAPRSGLGVRSFSRGQLSTVRPARCPGAHMRWPARASLPGPRPRSGQRPRPRARAGPDQPRIALAQNRRPRSAANALLPHHGGGGDPDGALDLPGIAIERGEYMEHLRNESDVAHLTVEGKGLGDECTGCRRIAATRATRPSKSARC